MATENISFHSSLQAKWYSKSEKKNKHSKPISSLMVDKWELSHY